ncbi:MAG: PH domain-containing protein [Candidatus Krumholzibacteriia bacterium]
MNTRSFEPNPRYLSKLMLNITLVAVAIGTFVLLMSWPIRHDEGARVADVFTVWGLGVAFVYWLIAMVLVGPYYRSLHYEVRDDEVVVHVGIWVKSVKHVPFRTVTNIAIKRDIFDRWFFGLGTLNIQTAGMSGAKGAEERLVGLPNFDPVYEMVATELRRFRGGMSPTAADVEDASATDAAKTLAAMLGELKAIRKAVDR